MEEAKIVKQFTRFILPFHFTNPDEALDGLFVESSKGKPKYIFKRVSQNSYNLRQGLEEMLSADGGNTKIADIFELNADCRTLFNLPKKEKGLLTFYSRSGSSFKVRIGEVRLCLFESGVGLFETEAEYEGDGVDDYIDCNYFISEIKSDKNYFETEVENFDAETKERTVSTVKFTFMQLAEKVLAYIKVNGKSAVDLRDKNGGKSIIYSYLLLDRQPENISELMFNVRKNYKASYKYPELSGADPNVKRQFENSYWGASFNGAVNVSYLVGDEKTDGFFKENFYSLMHQTYYSLFLHILHQRYSLLKYIGDMGDLDKLTMDYDVMSQQLKAAKNYKASAASLKFRAFFKQPSTIEHVNDYYILLTNTFRIGELYANFTKDLDDLEKICDVYVSRIKNRMQQLDRRRRIKIEIFVAIFGTIVGAVSLFSDYWELMEKITGKAVNFLSFQLLVFFGLLLLPIVTSLVNVYYSIKDIRKITSDLDGDLEDGLVNAEDDRKIGGNSGKRHKRKK